MLLSAEGQYRRQAEVSATAALTVKKLWRRLGQNFSRDWERVGPQIVDTVQSARAAAVVTALPYTAATLAEQNVDAPRTGQLVGARFLATAPSGAPVSVVVEEPIIRTRSLVGEGMPVRSALEQGGSYLAGIVLTLMADTRRSVYGVDIASRPGVGGYVRMLQAPSCSRCVILAGKFFRWNDGFQRHPRCFPAGVLVSGPEVEGATRRWYDGELVVLTTASGEELPTTGNHPILTSRGWVPANLIKEGDEVVRSTRPEGAAAIVVPDHDQVPSRIEDVWGSLRMRGLVRVESSPEDFHGDGQDGEVDVVRADGSLNDGMLSAFAEHIEQEHLTLAPGLTLPFDGQGPAEFLNLRDAAHSGGSVGRLGLIPSLGLAEPGVAHHPGFAHATPVHSGFRQYTGDWSAGNTVLAGEPILGGSVEVLLDDLFDGQFSNLPRWNAPGDTFALETADGYSAVGRDLLERLSGQVELDRVVKVRRVQWSGHVYSLNSSEGWHVANSLIVSNCDCEHVAVTGRKSAEDAGLISDPYDYFRSLSEKDQDRLFGRANAQAIRDGGDIYRVQNVRQRGLSTALGRGKNRTYATMTSDDIYAMKLPREESIRLLTEQGYIKPYGQQVRQAAEIYSTPISRPIVAGSNRDRVLTARASGVRDPLDRATMTAAERRLYDDWYRWRYAETFGTSATSIGANSMTRYELPRAVRPGQVDELEAAFMRRLSDAVDQPNSQSLFDLAELLEGRDALPPRVLADRFAWRPTAVLSAAPSSVGGAAGRGAGGNSAAGQVASSGGSRPPGPPIRRSAAADEPTPGRVSVPAGARPVAHEIDTATRLASAGHDVEFLVPSNLPGAKTPDVLVDGIRWEMKSPLGSSKTTISNQLARAAKQSDRLILDTSRTPIPDAEIIDEVRRRIAGSTKFVEVLILTKNGEIVRLER